MALTAVDIQAGIAYLKECLGAPYIAWFSGEMGEGPPAWVSNDPPPPSSVIRNEGGFCAAVPTLL